MHLVLFLLQVAMEKSPFTFFLPSLCYIAFPNLIPELLECTCLVFFSQLPSQTQVILQISRIVISFSSHHCFCLGTYTDLSSFDCLNISFTFFFEISDYTVICHIASILCFNAISNSCI